MFNSNNVPVIPVSFNTDLNDVITQAQYNNDYNVYALVAEFENNSSNSSLPINASQTTPWVMLCIGQVYILTQQGNTWFASLAFNQLSWIPFTTQQYLPSASYANFGVINYHFFDPVGNNVTAATQCTTPGFYVGSTSLTDKPSGATGVGYNIEVKGIVNEVSGNYTNCFTQTYSDTAGVWIRAYNGSEYTSWTQTSTFTFA
jgi:hypothetical protein